MTENPEYREDWINTISPHTGDEMLVDPNRVEYFLSLGWKKIEEVVFPKMEGLPTNTHLWYWAKVDPCNIAPCPSINYYFRSLEMAQYVSESFDIEHKNIHCYPIIDMTGCQWWMVHFYNQEEPLEEIHDWCLKNAKNYGPGSFWEDVEGISASEGWEKSINNLSEFRKLFLFEGKICKKSKKEIWYVWEKDGKPGYRWEATGLDDKAVDWALRCCFESRTRRTYITDDGKYALVMRNIDWTRFYHLNKIIPLEHGAWARMNSDGYPGAIKILFDKKSRRDIVVKVLKQWYG